MKKQERIQFIQEVLNEHFPNPPIPLKHTSHYTLLIAVLLSAQCTDERVNKVTPELFRRANTPEKMAKLSVEEIKELIKTCGLTNFKAQSIRDLSQILVEKHGGKVPNTFKELEALPGVGHKTASVVMVQAFNKPAFPVDTHIHRLAKRWKLSKGTTISQTESDLKKCFPENCWNKLHLQMIYFGRSFCPARGHKKENCPICKEI